MVWCLGYPGILHFSLILAWSILPPIMQEILVTKQTWWSWCIFLNVYIYIYISNRYIKIYIYIHTHDTAIFGGSMKISPNHPKKAAVNDRPYLLSGQPVGSNLWGSTLKAIRGVVGGGGGPYASCCLSPLKLEPFKRGQWDPRKIPNLRGMLWNL